MALQIPIRRAAAEAQALSASLVQVVNVERVERALLVPSLDLP